MQTERHVGARVKALREERGLMQKWLARQVGWPPERLSRFENGRRGGRLSLEDARKFQRALGLPSVDDLIPNESE